MASPVKDLKFVRVIQDEFASAAEGQPAPAPAKEDLFQPGLVIGFPQLEQKIPPPPPLPRRRVAVPEGRQARSRSVPAYHSLSNPDRKNFGITQLMRAVVAGNEPKVAELVKLGASETVIQMETRYTARDIADFLLKAAIKAKERAGAHDNKLQQEHQKRDNIVRLMSKCPNGSEVPLELTLESARVNADKLGNTFWLTIVFKKKNYTFAELYKQFTKAKTNPSKHMFLVPLARRLRTLRSEDVPFKLAVLWTEALGAKHTRSLKKLLPYAVIHGSPGMLTDAFKVFGEHAFDVVQNTVFDGQNLLMLCLRHNQLTAVALAGKLRILLQHGADPYQEVDGRTAFDVATELGLGAKLQALITDLAQQQEGVRGEGEAADV
jgi:hypothetical protein